MSDTTRAPKEYEESGTEYVFTSREIFNNMVQNNRYKVELLTVFSSPFELSGMWTGFDTEHWLSTGSWSTASIKEIFTVPVMILWRKC